MEAIDYEELIREQSADSNKTDQFKRYLRLKDIARNLESLGRLADAEAKERERKTSG